MVERVAAALDATPAPGYWCGNLTESEQAKVLDYAASHGGSWVCPWIDAFGEYVDSGVRFHVRDCGITRSGPFRDLPNVELPAVIDESAPLTAEAIEALFGVCDA